MISDKISNDSNSVIDWIGKIPKHWEVRKTKHLFKLVCEQAPMNNNLELLSIYTAIGVRPRKELEARGNKATTTDNYWVVKKKDIIVNKLLAWMGAIGISEYDGVTSPAYDILRAREGVNPYYYNYLFRSPLAFREFKKHSRGIMDVRLRLYFSELGNIFLPFPIIEEQTAIARFLDYKLAKINRFIRKKKQLIKLLNEQKAAIINQAVTKGLDHNAKMKDSGIEWLGEIPESWEVKPIKYFVTCNDEALTEKTEKEYQLRYIDIGNVDENGKVSEIVVYKFKDAPSRARRIVKEGDIIVSTVRTYLKAITQIKGDTSDLVVSTGFAVLRPRKKMSSDFLNYAIRANYFISKIMSESKGVNYPAINSTELVTMKIAVPSFVEQQRLVDLIDKETATINTTISNIEKEIALVEEYKTALIAEAVTGKIDVRGFEMSEIENLEENYEESEEEISIAAEDGADYQTEETE